MFGTETNIVCAVCLQLKNRAGFAQNFRHAPKNVIGNSHHILLRCLGICSRKLFTGYFFLNIFMPCLLLWYLNSHTSLYMYSQRIFLLPKYTVHIMYISTFPSASFVNNLLCELHSWSCHNF